MTLLLLIMFCAIAVPFAIILLVDQYQVVTGKKPSRWEVMQIIHPKYKGKWKYKNGVWIKGATK